MWICGECGRVNDIENEVCPCMGNEYVASQDCIDCMDRATIYCHRAIIDYGEEE